MRWGGGLSCSFEDVCISDQVVLASAKVVMPSMASSRSISNTLSHSPSPHLFFYGVLLVFFPTLSLILLLLFCSFMASSRLCHSGRSLFMISFGREIRYCPARHLRLPLSRCSIRTTLLCILGMLFIYEPICRMNIRHLGRLGPVLVQTDLE